MERVPLATTMGAMSCAGVLSTTGPATQTETSRLTSPTRTRVIPRAGMPHLERAQFAGHSKAIVTLVCQYLHLIILCQDYCIHFKNTSSSFYIYIWMLQDITLNSIVSTRTTLYPRIWHYSICYQTFIWEYTAFCTCLSSRWYGGIQGGHLSLYNTQIHVFYF